VEQPLAEFGVFGEMGVDMQRLRIHGEQAEHRVIHLGNGPAEFMMKLPTDLELLKIQSRHHPPFSRAVTPGSGSASSVIWRPLFDERIQPFLTIFRRRDKSKTLGRI